MDCTSLALALLAGLGVHLQSVPPVVVRSDLQFPGWYEAGVVYVRDPGNCRVIAHEFFHHWQFEKRGPARSAAEWEARERQAFDLID